MPSLAVVLACREGFASCAQWQAACVAAGAELVIVAADPIPAEHRRQTGVLAQRVPGDPLTPELWSAGLDATRAEIVAFSTSLFKPNDDYFPKLLEAFEDESAAGVGGAIAPPQRASGAAVALYLLRYGGYRSKRRTVEVDDFAGDNAAYRVAALQAYRPWIRARGFWEHELHAQMRQDGHRLLFDPAIRVTAAGRVPFALFFRQRWRHGLEYGREHADGKSPVARLALALRTAALPALLVARAARSAFSPPAMLLDLARALPSLTMLAIAWSAGEAVGSLRGTSTK